MKYDIRHSSNSSFLFLNLYLHILRTIVISTILYNQNLWLSGSILFYHQMFISFLGYVLSWGQMSFWGQHCHYKSLHFHIFCVSISFREDIISTSRNCLSLYLFLHSASQNLLEHYSFVVTCNLIHNTLSGMNKYYLSKFTSDNMLLLKPVYLSKDIFGNIVIS